MWILYFDKVPKYHFGTVRQQLWMALHLPFHLAILGVVEGACQIAQARYIYYSIELLVRNAHSACVKRHLDGQALASNLTRNIAYFKINESARGREALDYVWQEMYILGNTTNICSPANTSAPTEYYGVPMTFERFFYRAIGAMFQSFEIDIPAESENVQAVLIALRSWIVVYIYFWSAIILLLVCYTVTSLLADSEKARWRSVRKYASFSMLSRAIMIIVAILQLVLGVTSGAPQYKYIQHYIASSWILPTVVLSLWVICLSDRASKIWARRSEMKARYESVAVVDRERRDSQEMDMLRRRGTNAYGYPSH